MPNTTLDPQYYLATTQHLVSMWPRRGDKGYKLANEYMLKYGEFS